MDRKTRVSTAPLSLNPDGGGLQELDRLKEMRFTHKHEISFYRKIKISLALMGVIPFLITVYLVSMEFSDGPSTLMILCSALVLFSILLGFTLLRKSSDQVASLAAKTTLSETGDLPDLHDINVDGELNEIANNFNSVVEQLQTAKRDIQSRSHQLQTFARDLSESYEHLEKQNRLRDKLCRYVGKDLVEKLMASGDGQLLHNERKCVTVMFADIRSFTSLSEYMEPEDVVAMLNEYFAKMTDILFKYNGMLDKFVGDQIMAVFGHISNERDGARSAVRAAMEMQKATVALMRERKKERLPVFNIGIGINTGSAILASVGSSNRQDYTVIGDTVNTSARLEKHAQSGEIVIGERTRRHLPKQMELGERVELRMRNRSTPIGCYVQQPLRKKSQPAPAQQDIPKTGTPLIHTAPA